MKKTFQILSMAVIVMAAVSCGTPDITYSDEPLAAVQLNGKWGYIDTKGNEIIPCKYDTVQEWFYEGLAAVKLGDKWTCIDKTGKAILKLSDKYYEVRRFSSGLAAVRKSKYSSYYSLINKKGKEVTASSYEEIRRFSEGRAAVVNVDKWGFIDTTGKEVIPLRYIEVSNFSGGRARVKRLPAGAYHTTNEIIDRDGNVVGKWESKNILGEWDGHSGNYSSEGWALHKKVELSGYISSVYFADSAGNRLHSDYAIKSSGITIYANDKAYADAKPFSEGFAAVKAHNKKIGTSLWGFIDKTGKMVIPHIYYDVDNFNEGFAAVQQAEPYQDYFRIEARGKKWGFIDRTGKIIAPFRYDKKPYFSEGMAVVERDGKYGYCNTSGNEVIPCKYEYGGNFQDGFAKVENENGFWGVIDKTGREIVPCEYRSYLDLGIFLNGLCAVKRNGKWGFVDTTGKDVIPCKYEVVYSFN